MADRESNARLRADAGAPTSGVIHIRTRLDAEFTVISNDLAQQPGSAVVVGVAAYIASLPDGTPVSIDALCGHFDEGEILISRALRVLEEAGYLDRRRERQSNGNICTRTYFYDVPCGDTDPDGPLEPPSPPRPRKTRRAAADGTTPPVASTPDPAPQQPCSQPQPQPEPEPEPEPEQPVVLADIDPQVLAVLTSLRRVDPRLDLSMREAARLAPGISQWLAAGMDKVRIVSLLTERLPDHFLGRPVGILAYRLRETPLPLPPPSATATPTVQDRPAVIHPLQNCDGCDRAFRTPVLGGRCRECRSKEQLRAVC
ncbi:hypothetical protein [Streptomyces sp. YIM S03343]